MSEILNDWLPFAFAAVMGLAMLAYTVLDGYDLGVGILLPHATDKQKDMMIASIGPFWDANETWLVLGIGVLLVAFPAAHGIILTALYLPVTIMLGGLILRGVAFDFRAKANAKHKHGWDMAFYAGSLIASVSQGFMLGQYIIGFNYNLDGIVFSILIGGCFVAGYALIGACWLIFKTEGALQKKAVGFARYALWGTALGVITVSAATPLVSPRIFEKWFAEPNIYFLAPIPVITAFLFIWLEITLKRLPRPTDKNCLRPLIGVIIIYVLCFIGLAYSFYPYVIQDKLTIWEAASSRESLMIIFVGTCFVLPAIIGYTIFAYHVFRGKAQKLEYY